MQRYADTLYTFFFQITRIMRTLINSCAKSIFSNYIIGGKNETWIKKQKPRPHDQARVLSTTEFPSYIQMMVFGPMPVGWNLWCMSKVSSKRIGVYSTKAHWQTVGKWHVAPSGSNIYLTLFSVSFSVEPMSSTDHSRNYDIVFVGGTALWNFVRVIVVLRLTIW